MALYIYIKKHPPLSLKSRLFIAGQKNSAGLKKTARATSLILLFGGLIMVGTVVYPILNWYTFISPTIQTAIISPLATTMSVEKSPINPVVVNAQDGGKSPSTEDSYKISTWFVGAKNPALQTSEQLKIYTLTIPKLKIDGATVTIGGDDLKKSLLGWSSAALPGSYGNSIVFGHSELPAFASPKDYSGIFTSLMDLKQDDEIYLDYDGVRYKYLVIEKKVVAPTDLSVLEQRFDSSYITLITCVPPGTTWERGVVRGKLTQI